VKVKLDEGLPVSLAERLAKHGIDADTVLAENLSGRSDPEVLAAAVAENRIVFTLDRGCGNIRAYPPGSLHYHLVTYRGPRREETCALNWPDVDLDQKKILIQWQLVVVGWKVQRTRPKTDAGVRELLLDDLTVEEF
jgi:hypothetical protein